MKIEVCSFHVKGSYMKKLLILGMFFMIPLMAKENQVLVFAGSTRTESINKKLAQKAADSAREMGASVTYIDLKDYPLPFYEGDLEAKEGLPENARKLRNLMIASSCIVIASPEYNGSLPALLKNVIDWASRTEEGLPSRDAFKKKFVVMSASPSPFGGARVLKDLRALLVNMGGEVLEKHVSVPNAYEKDALENVTLKEELKEAMGQFFQTVAEDVKS